ncbi:lantibiotic dehydratase [Saccharothrix sp. HUAS TT1]|uniref:lantibiotic dehydratase n=1 Tax=unclassified Saccharothrix TaxID=2593673 RepID=UPI00345BB38D
MGDQGVLLRLAGWPAGLWLAGACPGLFAALADVDAEAAACREHGRALAARLGDRVVPRPEVTAAERQAVLRVRRAAHGGRPLPDDAVVALARSAAARVDPPSAIGVDRLVARARSVREAEARLRDDLAAEQRRLAGLPWRLLRSSPVGSAALGHDAADVVADVELRLAAGEGWDGKRLRQRADHLWRLIARGAVKTTPRSWFGHLAVTSGSGPLTAGPFATLETPNVHTSHAPRTGLSTTGLHWSEDGSLVTWAPHEREPGRLREVRVRDTPALRAVRHVVADGPRTEEEILTALLGPNADAPAGRAALTAFLDHLVGLGVLRRGRRVTERVSGWGPARATPRVGEDFLDVHRRVTGAAPTPDVRPAVGLLRRVDALIRQDGPPGSSPVRELVDERPTPVPELVRRFLATRSARPATPADRGTWPVARDPGSGYAALLRVLAEAGDAVGPGGAVELTDDLLDAVGAPRPSWEWPVDCLVRPLPGGSAVLDCAVPAGALDARFARGLRLLHGAEPGPPASYREFLRRFERTTGGRLVEVLVPPHNARSANTVRRPVHTDLWTGDPDPLPYFGEPHPGRHVPLHAITLRRDGGAVVAEAGGERLWPVHHATRAPFAPWDVALALLVAAGPRDVRRGGWHRPHALTAFPDRRHLPRVTAGPVVVSRAQWRVGRDELWPPDAGVEAKFRALGRLTRARSLPRWVFAGPAGGRQAPVDLAGLPALRLLDRALAGGDELIFVEMLPDPTGFPVVDAAHDTDDRLACQLLLRLPVTGDTDFPLNRAEAALVADAV